MIRVRFNLTSFVDRREASVCGATIEYVSGHAIYCRRRASYDPKLSESDTYINKCPVFIRITH